MLKSDLVRDVKSSWTIKEDIRLTYLVKEKGAKKWKQIAAQIPSKKPKQCWERWYNHLNPNIKKDSWSLEEEMVLFIINRDLGNRWKDLAQILECRSENNIKNQWKWIMQRKYQKIFDEIERQFRATCAKQDINYMGVPIIKDYPCSIFYREFYQQFEKELLEQLTDQIKMQNMVYFQQKEGSVGSENQADNLLDTYELSEKEKSHYHSEMIAY